MVYKIQFLLLVFISAFLGIIIAIIINNIEKDKQNIAKKENNVINSKNVIKLFHKYFGESYKKNIEKNNFFSKLDKKNLNTEKR